MPVVSVIIPVYNTDKFIIRCLDSVINQTLTDIEILCVNDGSTDNSLQILKEYQSLDRRIKIINQYNQGVSAARNNAMKVSNAKYIFFLDSDDWIEATCLYELYTHIDSYNKDIVFSLSKWYTNTGILLPGHNYEQSDWSDNIENYHLICQVCGKMYRKSFLDKNNRYFYTNLITAEDTIFNFQNVMLNAQIGIVNKFLYNYSFLRNGSATSVLNKKNSDLQSLKNMLDSDIYINASEFHKIAFINTYLGIIMHWYNVYHCNSYKKQIRKIYKYLIKHVSINILQQCPTYIGIKNISKTMLQNIISFDSWNKLYKKIIKRSTN